MPNNEGLKILCQVCGNVIIDEVQPCEACGNMKGWVSSSHRRNKDITWDEEEMIDWVSMHLPPPEGGYSQDEEMADDIQEPLQPSDHGSAIVSLLRLLWWMVLLIISYFVIKFYARELASGYVFGLFAVHNFFTETSALQSAVQWPSVRDFFIWGLPVVVLYLCSSQRDAIVSFLDEKLPHPFKFVVSDLKFAIKIINDSISYMRFRASCMFLVIAISAVFTAVGVSSSIAWFAAIGIPAVIYAVLESKYY